MKQKIINLVAYLILTATIIFNLWLNFPETQILADPNDNIFQYSLVYRTNWIWENYGCPLSLSCLPNLIDHNVTTWAEGYPLPFYYSHIPQIATVASYNLLIKPLLSFISYPLSLYQYYNWTKYLLYTLFPISIFLSLRIIGFKPIVSAIGAFFAMQLSTDGLYGIDPVSFLWRGYGLTSQLYGLFFLPLALAFVYRYLLEDREWSIEDRGRRSKVEDRKNIRNLFSILYSQHLSPITYHLSSNKNLLFAILFLTLTTAGHLGIGIIGILSTLPFLFLDLKPNNILARTKKLFLVLISSFIVLSYWLIPILLNNQYHIISFWDPIWKFNSYGWYEVVKQFFMGETFDWQRSFPIITLLVSVGFFAILSNSPNSPSYSKRGLGGVIPFSLLFAFWFLMYFGRTTWGGLIDLIPGMKDFHQHRFIVGIHIAALFLIPAGIEYIFQLFKKISKFNFLTVILKHPKIPILKTELNAPKFQSSQGEDIAWQVQRNLNKAGVSEKFGIEGAMNNQTIIFYILTLTFISTIAYFTMQRTIQYTKLNNQWIVEANSAYKYDEKNFQNLVGYLNTLPSARLYAGRPGNWGHDFRLGSTQMYMLFGVNGFDMSQFLPETWSMLSENEQNFDERVAEDFDLLNLKYIIADRNQDFSPSAKLDKKFGPFELYQVPTTGWFDVVTSPMFVKTDKTNYINLVQLWHRSYARRWKMHPLISVEKNPTIPDGMQKVIEMKDEVTYQLVNPQPTTHNPQLNIFSDYPFVFPEATVSGKIRNETINRQTYSATVEVPNNCKLCFAMFKMSYHPDWQVKVDGKDAEKFAVFPFYLATPLTPGTHQVEFTYQPNRLKVVLLIIELLVGSLFLLRKIIRKRYLLK